MWDWFIWFLKSVLEFFANTFGDWGLAVIILTVIIRLALTPLTIKSTKSSAKMQALQPKLQEIQELYADDPQKQTEELQKFYSENKFNPLGGCLPVLIQMPVLFALFSVLKELPAGAHFYGILGSLSQSVSGAVAELGLAGAWVYVLLDLLFGVLTFVPMWLNSRNAAAEQRQQNLMMGLLMGAMMCWFGWAVPVGILLYYDTSSAWGAIQQQFITKKVLDAAKKEEEEKFANQPKIDIVRKERKPRPHKKK